MTPLLALSHRPDTAITASGRDMVRVWFNALCVVLAGYAIMGKGFAYLGAPPIFVAELLLLSGLVLLLVCPGWRRVFESPTILLLTLLSLWGAARTVPYLDRYKADALRDAVIFGYGLFAFIVAAWLMARPELIGKLVRRYAAFAGPFVLVIPVLWVAQQLLHGEFPRWPWASHVTVIHLKAADILVHLGGIAALAIVGLDKRRGLFWPLMLLGNAALAGAMNRGGLVAFAAIVFTAFCFYPHSAWIRRMAVVGVVTFAALAIINPEIETPNDRRRISFEQLTTNVMSITGSVRKGDLDGTKAWRLDWWGKIVDYTLHGSYFWTGKGFGINLADSDGFQVFQDGSLRSPHNGHLTVLARAGVPGALLWAAVHLSFAWMLLDAIRRARRRGDAAWAGLFVWILAYWVGFMCNASFDVFIEGPMGGVWFWSLMGFGIAASWVHRHHPDAAGLTSSPRSVPCV